jgi:uncharacterized protein YyaL (SSP411 family)
MIAFSGRRHLIALLGLASLLSSLAQAEEKPAIAWQPWSDDLFQRAAAQHKLVLLDLQAIWCHWCHVMDATTYSDPKVIALINKNYIAVRVDQDERPDLSNRYEDYGWPATVIFKWDGSEFAKRRGYIPPESMASTLQAFVDDPTPGPSIENEPAIAPAAEGALSNDQRSAMRAAFLQAYDSKLGGWGTDQKLLDWTALTYCLTQGAAGDGPMKQMARQTLSAGLKLIDPVWGGVDQYSIDGDWNHPHFEKIMPFQAENMRVFALAASLWREPRWLLPAQKIHGYLTNFLTSPDGAFYTSQDADLKPGEYAEKYFALDDAARRKAGVPRIDRHIYARENGLAITGLTALYAATGDATALTQARRAAEWIMRNRALPGGGFRHGESDSGDPYLADTLEMARAFLSLYTVTADRTWLVRARAAAEFIDTRFRAPIGFATAAAPPSAALRPGPEVDENITLARFATLLAHYTGRGRERDMAIHAMRFLASPAVVRRQGSSVSGILLADDELRADPAHIVIVGPKGDPAARALFTVALQYAPPYKRLEWYDPAEGPLPNADLEYPALPNSTAFLCTSGACSSPLNSAPALSKKLAAINK